jgi:uncharacterized membrane protein YgaE (UPF0421/DUF939 family)
MTYVIHSILIFTLLIPADLWAVDAKQQLIENLASSLQKTKASSILSTEEKNLREDFLYRLKFKLQINKDSENIRRSVLSCLQDIGNDNSADTNLKAKEFAKSLAKSINEDFEPTDDLSNHINNFFSRQRMTDPGSNEQAFAQDYLNRKSFMAALPVSADQAGAIAEEKLQQKSNFPNINWINEYNFQSTPTN